MAAPKKTFDMKAVAKAAKTALTELVKAGETPTVASVTKHMQDAGQDLATTRCATLLKQLSNSNDLGGWYLRRGQGFVHEDKTPRTEAKATKPRKSSKKAKSKVVSPSALAEQIRTEERLAAEKELREQIRNEERARVGLAG